MANETIKALFAAKETISNALKEASIATEDFHQDLNRLENMMLRANEASDGAERAFESLSSAETELASNTQVLRNNLNSAERVLNEVTSSGRITDAQMEELTNSLLEAKVGASQANSAFGDMQRDLVKIAAQSDIASEDLDELRNAIFTAGMSAENADAALSGMQRGLLALMGSAQSVDRSVSGLSKSISGLSNEAILNAGVLQISSQSAEGLAESYDDVRNSSFGAAAAVQTLNSVISESILNFGSLSVNIGPFNIALRNFLTQVPAILTGMGSMVSLITALIAGFGTLAVVVGGLFAGGALAFFEDFSAQFEDSAEAVEAMGAALRDLFVEAMEPLMNDTNADFFVDTINAMARGVNRFAQFVSQMRDEVEVVFNNLEGDIDNFFNALRDTFVTLRPILISILNFFMNDFSPILERMGELSENLSDDIGVLIQTLGALLSQLLDLAGTIIAGVAPAVRILVGFLTILAKLINSLNQEFVSIVVFLGIMTIALFKVIGAMTGLIVTMINLNAALISNAAAGGFLGSVYSHLFAATHAYATTNKALSAILWDLVTAIWAEIVAFASDTKAKITNSIVTQALAKATRGLVSALKLSVLWQKLQLLWTKATTIAKYGLALAIVSVAQALGVESALLTVASAALSVYNVFASIAAGVTSVLAGALHSLAIPVYVVIGAILLLVAALAALVDYFGIFDVDGAFISFFEGLANWIGNIVDDIMKLLGLKMDNPPGAGGTPDPDEIQTSSNVNLNFEDKLEQNMEVQADPEDKEGLRRIVKDAMDEANSVARRQEGLGR